MKVIPRSLKTALLLLAALYGTAGLILTIFGAGSHNRTNFDQIIADNSSSMMAAGRQTFRFDTFGDEAFWGDTLQLHLAIEGENFGGVGPADENQKTSTTKQTKT